MQQTLDHREGTSDKVYQVAVEPKGDDLFMVNFAYGRRGATLQTGTKTQTPVAHDRAVSIFEKLVKEKTAKGYTPGENGTPFQHTEKQPSGIHCQLLNPIEEADLHKFIRDDRYCAQEKFDGRRLLVRKEGAAIHGINRKGLYVGLPSLILQSVHRLPGDFILDGEAVGDVLHVFDLLHLNGEDLRPLSYRQRYTSLLNLMAAYQSHHQIHHLELVGYVTRTKDKAALLHQLLAEKREGIVFKNVDAPYTADRPNSGGPQLKHKFYATLSAVVATINTQRSVEVRLLNHEGWLSAGNVTIPPNHAVPSVGAVVEVRYLYAFPESGCLYQPTYLGVRDDVTQMECSASQLKFKPTEEET